MAKFPLTRNKAKVLRILAKVGMEQARDEPDPKLAEMQRSVWRKALAKAWPPLRVVKPVRKDPCDLP